MRPADFVLDDRVVGDRELDAESAQWLRALGVAGVERDQAAVRLHQLLLRIARNEVHRSALRRRLLAPNSMTGLVRPLGTRC
jgi:RNA polymerase sigma-70 factor (ECF subfamily)